MSQHTLSIFRLFLNRLPPFFPEYVADQMRQSLLRLESDREVSVAAVEDAMIKFGYDFWPWHEAYSELHQEVENRLGEQFFVAHLPDHMKDNFVKYTDYGLSWQDMYSGQTAHYYESADRAQLAEVLIKTKNELTRLVKREIVGLSREKYLSRVEDHQKILADIKNTLEYLRRNAKEETYHPALANEIKDKVRHFELGLCLLGPRLTLDDVQQSVDFFAERRKHLDLLRGIDQPVEVDFYQN